MWGICVCAFWPGIGPACDWFGRIVLLLGGVVGEPLGVVWKALGGQEKYEENIMRHLVCISSPYSTSSGNSGTHGVKSRKCDPATKTPTRRWHRGEEAVWQTNLFPCHDVFLLTKSDPFPDYFISLSAVSLINSFTAKLRTMAIIYLTNKISNECISSLL